MKVDGSHLFCVARRAVSEDSLFCCGGPGKGSKELEGSWVLSVVRCGSRCLCSHCVVFSHRHGFYASVVGTYAGSNAHHKYVYSLWKRGGFRR